MARTKGNSPGNKPAKATRSSSKAVRPISTNNTTTNSENTNSQLLQPQAFLKFQKEQQIKNCLIETSEVMKAWSELSEESKNEYMVTEPDMILQEVEEQQQSEVSESQEYHEEFDEVVITQVDEVFPVQTIINSSDLNFNTTDYIVEEPAISTTTTIVPEIPPNLPLESNQTKASASQEVIVDTNNTHVAITQTYNTRDIETCDDIIQEASSTKEQISTVQVQF